MGYDYRTSNWQTVEEKYEELSNEGLCWDLRRQAWIRHDGTVVYASDGSGSAQRSPEASPRVVDIDVQTSYDDIHAWLRLLQTRSGVGDGPVFPQHSLERQPEREHDRPRAEARRPIYSHDSRENDLHQQPEDSEMSEAGAEVYNEEQAAEEDGVHVDEEVQEMEEARVAEDIEADELRHPPVPSRNAQDYYLDPHNTPWRFDWRRHLESTEGPTEALERRAISERFNTLARSVGTWEI